MLKVRYLLLVPLLVISCKSTSEFTGFSYDPPDVTNTVDKITEPQKKRTIGAGNPKVWVSNEFESARLNDFYQVNDSTFEILIKPENAPINNSPWYAFDIWSDTEQQINLRIAYSDARHRYLPKLTNDFDATLIEPVTYDTATGAAQFRLDVDTTPKRISAQSLMSARYSDLIHYSEALEQPFISVDTVGYSHLMNPVLEIHVDETNVTGPAGVLIILSRQHPPEISGYLTSRVFFETLLDTTELAKEFRKHFVIRSFPMVNPDGVINGHWRHNTGGIDLNRDWENFNQPETQAIRDALLPLANDPTKKVYYGIDFHSTNENIFYPINEEIMTFPDNLTQRWAQVVKAGNPDILFVTEEFDTSSPISKNWIYKTFGADAVTFEVDDELPRDQIRQLGRNSAISLMEMLIEEWNNYNSD